MTIAEVIRAIESKKRVQQQQAQEKASFDYILADLIGRSVSRLHSSSNRMPQINEAYPSIFDNDEMKAERQRKQDELTVARFKLFAQSYNSRYKVVAKDE